MYFESLLVSEGSSGHDGKVNSKERTGVQGGEMKIYSIRKPRETDAVKVQQSCNCWAERLVNATTTETGKEDTLYIRAGRAYRLRAPPSQ